MFHALRGINLTIGQGQFFTHIGHSGCGNSTLPNMVAGWLDASSGMALYAGREIKARAGVRGGLFQNHALLPWLTCFDNIHLAVERG